MLPKTLLIVLVLFLFLLFLSMHAKASDSLSESLMIDQTIVNSELIQFRNDNKVYPEKSQFKVIHALTMSNEQGERWATVTIKNMAGGRRIFEANHLLALFANGKRIFPDMQEELFDSKETRSVTVYFGNSRFPILSIVTREN
ncbi:hypothetical protein [Aliikangiella sp. G2MR2-5]|uniref:hypothetical protein n=1 Tax=Aliikangiella sp. G2MR2-5 TaxID=2788943 RepID=UPI0018AA21E4|nr:hypothetical protein [Aliikangiella sp. G2MR2-5]